MNDEAWSYRCSICDELVAPDEVAAHLEEEKGKASWPGILEWVRVDHTSEPDESS